MSFWFWTLVRWLGALLGDLGLWIYWAGKHGQRRCKGKRK